MSRILLIDNYDSFVHNLARYFRELGCEAKVARNDRISMAEIREWSPAAIVISPGPCTPREAGISETLVRELGPAVPILGVCLGHQAICTALGGSVMRAGEPVHGRTSLVTHDASGLFAGLESPLCVARYHSLIVSEDSLPESLSVTSRTDCGTIMSVRHRSWPTFGVQFHPESVLTCYGHQLLENFLRLSEIPVDSGSAREPISPLVKPLKIELEKQRPHHPPLHW